MASIHLRGIDRFQKRLDQVSGLVKREAASIVKQEARALAVEFGSATVPGPGFDEPKKFRKRVEAEIRQVYASRKDPGRIYQLMMVHAPHLAGAYWRAIRLGKSRSADAILKKANLPEGLSPGDHRTARRGKRASVARGFRPVSLAAEPSLRAYVKKKVDLVGIAKAGWYAAAKGIGGRVRRNTTVDGKRKTIEIFPSWVRKLARDSRVGGATVSEGSKPSVTIWNSVKHASAALKPSLKAAALSRANDNLRRSLKLALAEIVKRGR